MSADAPETLAEYTAFLAREIIAQSVRNGCTLAETVEHVEAMKDELPALVAGVLQQTASGAGPGSLPA